MSGYKTLKQINENPIYAPIGCEEEFKRRIFLDNFQRCMNIREFQKTAGIIIKKKITGIHPLAKIIQKPIREYQLYLNQHKYSPKPNTLHELEEAFYDFFGVKRSFYDYYKEKLRDHFKHEPCRKDRFSTDIYGIDYKNIFWNKKDKPIHSRIKRFHKVREYWHKLTNIDVGYTNVLNHENPAFFRYYTELVNPDIVDGFLRIGYVKFIQLFMNWIINVRAKDSSKGLQFEEMYHIRPKIIGAKKYDDNETISSYDIINLVKNENFSKLYPLKNL